MSRAGGPSADWRRSCWPAPRARLRLPPGEHTVRIHARGITKDYRVSLRKGGWSFLVMTALR